MRYFYDCEFLEDGHKIDLISIGIVADDGREYYAVNHDADWDRISRHHWLCSNVVPSLPLRDKPKRPSGLSNRTLFSIDTSDVRVKPKWVIANEVREFLLAANPQQDAGQVELWAHYGAYDHVALCQLWGSMTRLPKGIPMFTHDIMQAAAGRELPEQPGGAHNALEDARHVRAMWEHLAAQP